MKQHAVWDPFLRVFHWAVVAGFAANALLIDEDAGLHIWIGYAVAALVGARLVWGLIGPRTARFSSFTPNRKAVVAQLSDIATARKTVHLGHSPLGALMIFNLLAALLAISVTGYLMTTDMFWGIGWVEDLHEVAVTWAEVSIIVHVAAVIWESRRTGVNLPRAMVTGVKSVPDEARLLP